MGYNNPDTKTRYDLAHRPDKALASRLHAEKARSRRRMGGIDYRSGVQHGGARIGLAGDRGMANERIGVVMRNYDDGELVSVVDFSAHGPTRGLLARG